MVANHLKSTFINARTPEEVAEASQWARDLVKETVTDSQELFDFIRWIIQLEKNTNNNNQGYQ